MQAAGTTPYKKLSAHVQEQITADRAAHRENPYKCADSAAIRRDTTRDRANLWRPSFARDTEKILHLPLYNRYADKTQVFSFFRNDDITRRALHVQLVSRIARSIGAVLDLNLDLIEAIALGHDIGHTPFGHAGEKFLSDLLYAQTGRCFNHNVHSVRVLDALFHRNVSLQTLDGILCHNGEFEMQEYRPRPLIESLFADASRTLGEQQYADELFEAFDNQVESCYTKGSAAVKKLVPTTLEACVVRICDMIAYLGKDRQDAVTAKIISRDESFSSAEIGTANATIINNLTVDIINNSYGKDYLLLSQGYFQDLKTAKRENYERIYHNPKLSSQYDALIKPMFSNLYRRLLDDVKKGYKSSVIWKHHIDFMNANTGWYTQNGTAIPYEETEPNQIVTDYIASMTDDYFIDLHAFLFPNSPYSIEYKSYFTDLRP